MAETTKNLDILGRLRNHLAGKLGLIDQNEYKFLWVVDFPLVEYDEETKQWNSVTSSLYPTRKNMNQNPQDVTAVAYDVVLNGIELGGGSMRIYEKNYKKNIQYSWTQILMEKNSVFSLKHKNTFPPHGGYSSRASSRYASVKGHINPRCYSIS